MDEKNLIRIGKSEYYMDATNQYVYVFNEYDEYELIGKLELDEMCPIDNDDDVECDGDDVCVNITDPNNPSYHHRIKYYPLTVNNRDFADFGELILDDVTGDIYIRKNNGCDDDAFISATATIREELGGNLDHTKNILEFIEQAYNYRNENGDRLNFEEYVYMLIDSDLIINWKDPEALASQPDVILTDDTSIKVIAKPEGQAKVLYNDKAYDSPLHLHDLEPNTLYEFSSIIPQDNENFIKQSVSRKALIRTRSKWKDSEIKADDPKLIKAGTDFLIVEASPEEAVLEMNGVIYSNPNYNPDIDGDVNEFEKPEVKTLVQDGEEEIDDDFELQNVYYKIDGLTHNTSYEFRSVIPRDNELFIRENKSRKVVFKTEVQWNERDIVAKPPIVENVTETSATIKPQPESAKILWNGKIYDDELLVLNDLHPNTKYEVYSIFEEDNENFLKESKSEMTVFKTKVEWDENIKAERPIVNNVTSTSAIIVGQPTGAMVKFDGYETGVLEYEATNLSPNTEYTVASYIKEDIDLKIPASNSVDFKFKTELGEYDITPLLPIVSDVTPYSMVVTARPVTAKIYSYHHDKVFESPMLFENLLPNTEYMFKSVIDIDENFKPVESSDVTFKTEINWKDPEIEPLQPYVSNTTATTITVTSRPLGTMIRHKGQNFTSPHTFTSLKPNESYVFYSIVPMDEDAGTRELVSDPLVRKTDWNEPTVLAGKPLVSVSDDYDTIIVTGMPLSADNVEILYNGKRYPSPLILNNIIRDEIYEFQSVIPADYDTWTDESISDYEKLVIPSQLMDGIVQKDKNIIIGRYAGALPDFIEYKIDPIDGSGELLKSKSIEGLLYVENVYVNDVKLNPDTDYDMDLNSMVLKVRTLSVMNLDDGNNINSILNVTVDLNHFSTIKMKKLLLSQIRKVPYSERITIGGSDFKPKALKTWNGDESYYLEDDERNITLYNFKTNKYNFFNQKIDIASFKKDEDINTANVSSIKNEITDYYLIHESLKDGVITKIAKLEPLNEYTDFIDYDKMPKTDGMIKFGIYDYTGRLMNTLKLGLENATIILDENHILRNNRTVEEMDISTIVNIGRFLHDWGKSRKILLQEGTTNDDVLVEIDGIEELFPDFFGAEYNDDYRYGIKLNIDSEHVKDYKSITSVIDKLDPINNIDHLKILTGRNDIGKYLPSKIMNHEDLNENIEFGVYNFTHIFYKLIKGRLALPSMYNFRGEQITSNTIKKHSTEQSFDNLTYSVNLGNLSYIKHLNSINVEFDQPNSKNITISNPLVFDDYNNIMSEQDIVTPRGFNFKKYSDVENADSNTIRNQWFGMFDTISNVSVFEIIWANGMININQYVGKKRLMLDSLLENPQDLPYESYIMDKMFTLKDSKYYDTLKDQSYSHLNGLEDEYIKAAYLLDSNGVNSSRSVMVHSMEMISSFLTFQRGDITLGENEETGGMFINELESIKDSLDLATEYEWEFITNSIFMKLGNKLFPLDAEIPRDIIEENDGEYVRFINQIRWDNIPIASVPIGFIHEPIVAFKIEVTERSKQTVGPTEFIDSGVTKGATYGTSEHGYFGKVNNLITGNELIEKAGITEGETRISGDITWLKFQHNGKTLLVANDHIKNKISWDHLEEKRVVRGKVIDIDENKYLLRLLHGSAINPTESGSINDTIRLGNEWDDLIVKYTPDRSDSNWGNIYSWCQESGESNSGKNSYRVRRGYNSVANFGTNSSYSTNSYSGWRPVLEVL